MKISNLPRSPLGSWYGVLAIFASVAAVQASLFPRWPSARDLPTSAIMQSLHDQGLKAQRIQPTKSEAKPERTKGAALSAPLVFRFENGAELTLIRGSVAFRYGLQLASFTNMRSDLSLSERQLIGVPPSAAVGVIEGKSARQTCYVPQALTRQAFAVTGDDILRLVDEPTRGWRASMLRAIGIQPNYDYSCVVISLRSSNASPVPESLWRSILSALPSALRDDGKRVSAQAGSS